MIESDLGYLFWLGQVLDQAGYDAYPAKSIRDACTLVDQLQLMVDVLILNPALDGAIAFTEGIRRSRVSVKVIALVDDIDSDSLPDVDLVLHKPGSIDELSRSEWLQAVHSVVGSPCASRSRN